MSEIASAAFALRDSLRDGTSGLTGFDLDVKPSPQDPEEVECKFIIIGDTLEDAINHAKPLEDAGCNCTSTGETEITCECGSEAHE